MSLLCHFNRVQTVGSALYRNSRTLHCARDVRAYIRVVVRNKDTSNSVVFPEVSVNIRFLHTKLQLNNKGASLALFALHGNSSAHKVDKIFCDRHSQTCTLYFVCGTVYLAGERSKNYLLIFL